MTGGHKLKRRNVPPFFTLTLHFLKVFHIYSPVCVCIFYFNNSGTACMLVPTSFFSSESAGTSSHISPEVGRPYLAH